MKQSSSAAASIAVLLGGCSANPSVGGCGACPAIPAFVVSYTGPFANGVQTGNTLTFTEIGQTAVITVSRYGSGTLQPVSIEPGSACAVASAKAGVDADHLQITSASSGDCNLSLRADSLPLTIEVAVP